MTELRIENYEIPAADLGSENPLPRFRGPDRDSEHSFDPSISEEDAKYMGWETMRRILPYRMQDGYNRDRKLRAFKAAVLENEFIKATVLPELGGRLVSLIYKPCERELLERNPVFQPANLALRDAWFSGGIEWNTSQPGHYFLTCSPVFAARVEGVYGEPVLRIYEWDRMKCFPWQIDLILPPDSHFLFARIRLINPHDFQIPMYWWTNIAVPEKAGNRTLVPAETAIANVVARGLATVDLPIVNDIDITRDQTSPRATECFFRIPQDKRKWVASLDCEGKGFFETSTARLKGRKIFAWGMHPGGRLWQRHLSDGKRAYIELQAGLARTQLECLPMLAREEWTWTEAFGFIEADPAKVHSENWGEAWQAADEAVDKTIPQEQVDGLHDLFDSITRKPSAEVLHNGSGWAALERLRTECEGAEDRIPKELDFCRSSLGTDQEPWLQLLENGALPENDPQDEPGQYMVQPEWGDILEKSIKSGRSNHWLAWLHLGNTKFENKDIDGAVAAWEKSVECKMNGWALRNLSIANTRKNNRAARKKLLFKAWEAGPKIVPLALEYAEMLVRRNDFEGLRAFISQLPDDIKQNERIIIMAAQAAIYTGNLQDLDGFFDRQFRSIREGEFTLTELWFAYQERRISQEENIAIDGELKARVRRECPPPAHIDFRTWSGNLTG